MIPPDINYVPTLGIRPSEMNALEYSLGATKNNLKPCALLAPWGVSNSLENSIKRFEKAYPKEPYFLDIDRIYSPKNEDKPSPKDINKFLQTEGGYKNWIDKVYPPKYLDRPAQKTMKSLLDPKNGYENWINFIGNHQKVHPCIQCEEQDVHQIQQQIKAVKELKRPYCLRIDVQKHYPNMKDIIAAFAKEENYTIILEGGLVSDILTLTDKFSGFISTQLNTLNQSVPIVISYTSFPTGFVTISGIQPTIFENRLLVETLRNKILNRIVYGDWGSARPRDNRSGGNREPIPARIDYPTKEAWYIARNKEAGWNYQMAAKEIVKIPDWHGSLGIWGEDMIKRTVQNQSLGIDTPRKNVASRINIHLHRQAFYLKNDFDLTNIDLEDDFID